ncbi:MAG: protein kinase [Planctomycetes bacterium]|nr:protein kinase [Planctomycetota bacterium]
MSHPQIVRHGRNTYRVRGKRRFGDRDYLELERPGHHDSALLVLDPSASPAGDLRTVYLVDARNRDKVAMLKRVAEAGARTGLPRVGEHQWLGKNRLYFIVDWVEGSTLHEYLGDNDRRQHKQMSVSEAFKLYRSLAYTLKYMGDRNIVHGDIKPENLVIRGDPNQLTPIDYGSAWIVEATARRNEGDSAAFSS